MSHGKVYLVGAGPGHPGLVTLRGLQVLQRADLVLYDGLVNPLLLRTVSCPCERTARTKHNGSRIVPQQEINTRLIAEAKLGRNVVRLKGGDPYIFGRGSEEAAALEAAGIEYEVVPGITAATAAAEFAGFSLTHRDHAQQVRFVTGHSRKGELPEAIDWAGLADPSATTIFYMGGRMANKIADSLQAHGLSGETPTVICQAVTRPDERRWMGRLSQMPAAMMGIGVDAPVLIGVGAAFGVRNVSVQEAAPSGAPAAVGL
ncbi:MAG: uroporphyrinogen-III C-methyltransferase [Planctomycetaceae bacterium]|nr:uroporphyrinogen-III C-methyltransferase [Planctomycetaceae bacterium]